MPLTGLTWLPHDPRALMPTISHLFAIPPYPIPPPNTIPCGSLSSPLRILSVTEV